MLKKNIEWGRPVMKFLNRIKLGKLDYVMLVIMTILNCIGLYCIKQAYLFTEEKDEIYTKQLMGVVLGYIIIVAVLFFDYHFICKLSFVFYIGIVGILAITLKIGTNINNVRRWITILGIPFQPSEFTKVVLIIFMAYLLNHFRERLNKL